mmetsp:Transcript_19056/g.45635  ORF Transcript_19056/g.45635 Transcript_19056/m.45635 type:complete len:238 (-) Transcript_19056:32-745(-)
MTPEVEQSHRFLQSWTATHGYGLFRRMTGVGKHDKQPNGRVLTTVARPEVVVLGSHDRKTWTELEFKYKPGNVTRPPPFIAPHQPRVDWQMWFAALGTWQHNPWLVVLLHKLADNSTAAWDLLDERPPPFRTSPPTFFKANLFHYDFTSNQPEEKAWWRRTLAKEYLQTLDGDTLAQIVQSNHLLPDSPYEEAKGGDWAQTVVRMTSWIRDSYSLQTHPVLAIMAALALISLTRMLL